MNWENIKYIFQIPLAWYYKIHNKVFNAYGTNFIVVKDGDDDAMQIDVDEDSFKQAVHNAIDLSGVVQSVDGILPDVSGNVSLSGYVKTIDGISADEDGNIDLSDAYVTLSTDQTITGEKTFSQPINISSDGVLSADSSNLRLTYGDNGITLSGANNQLLDNEPARLYSQGADNQIATRGYCRLNFARISTLSTYVKTVNNIQPDENGNISVEIPTVPENIVNTVNGQTGDVVLGNIVNSVNNIAPVNGNVTLDLIDMQDVEDYVDGQLTDYVQQGDLTSYVQQSELTNYVTQNDITSFVTDTEMENYVDLQLLDYVKTVDGVSPVNGNVNFGLGTNKWMKTDASGHIATTNETPIFLSAGNTGYLYANNGSLQFKNDEYVTLSTQQDISGKKRFTQNDVTIVDNSLLLVDSQTNNGTSVSKNGVTINSPTPFIDFTTPGTAANDTFIAMTAASGYKLGINSPHGIQLDAPVNEAKLATQPTDTTTTSLAIATCGYVQSQLSGYTSTKTVKILADVSWDGTTLKKKFTNFDIKKGLITNVIQSPTWITIDTPVAYTP